MVQLLDLNKLNAHDASIYSEVLEENSMWIENCADFTNSFMKVHEKEKERERGEYSCWCDSVGYGRASTL